MQLLIEAIIVGIAVVLFGTVVSWLLKGTFAVDLPPVCKDWNKNYVMEIALFLTGVVTHLFFEFTDVNRWYCKHGNACRKR